LILKILILYTKATVARELNYKKQKEEYEKIFEFSDLKESPEHYLWILKKCRLKSPDSARILDVACGSGLFLHLAENFFSETFGLDIAESAIKKARRIASRTLFICGCGEYLPFPDESFDLVTNLGSLEHFLSPEKGVREIARVLKKNGRAYILVPNSYFLPIIINVWLKGDKGLKSNQPLERLATKTEWQQLLEKNGLKVERIFAYNYKTEKDPWLYRLLRPFIPFNLAYCFLYECQKKI